MGEIGLSWKIMGILAFVICDYKFIVLVQRLTDEESVKVMVDGP